MLRDQPATTMVGASHRSAPAVRSLGFEFPRTPAIAPGRRRCGRLAVIARTLHRLADLPDKGRDRPLALRGRRRGPRRRPSRRPRRLAADQRRQNPHLRAMHPPMPCGGRRVVFVTPLRALSAQTEVTLQRTFGPLGKTISALYGSIGVSGFDEDAIRQRHIVVATPEKLDFALRNDSSLLDDVGLLVFDEGHMIGLSEREVRYEVQIQRLLRRADAAARRIVCLSAILPDGDQLDDFAGWLRRDHPGGLIKHDWRPTRLRFGEVVWSSTTARLNLRVGDERPWVPRFLTGSAPPRWIPPKRRRTRPFPKDQRELRPATAWRLVEDRQTVLVFCPQ